MRGKRVLQIVFSGIEGDSSDKQFIIHVIYSKRYEEPLTVPDHRVSNQSLKRTPLDDPPVRTLINLL
jgi:hypothetical protein